MQTAQQIIDNRVNKIGVSSPNVALQGGNEIVIQLAGVHDPAKAAAIIGSTGQLQIFDFETSLAPPTVQGNQQPAPCPTLYGLLKAVQAEANKGTPEGYYLFKPVTKTVTTKVKGKDVKKTTTTHQVLQGPTLTRQAAAPALQGREAAAGHGGAQGAGRDAARLLPGSRERAPARAGTAPRRRQVLVPVQAAAGADGQGPRRVGHHRRRRPEHRRADRDAAVHGPRARTSSSGSRRPSTTAGA